MNTTCPQQPLNSEYTRLHITPLNPSLLNTILPPSILPNAKNISYHSLQTFPERNYGFVELPKMEAEKLKKKLHGSILKGTKVRVEAARPAKDLSPIKEIEVPKPRKEMKYWSKKRRPGEEVIPAAVIGDRHVKRGWTTPAAAIGKIKKESKKNKESKDKSKGRIVNKSKYTTGPECLFKTVLPANVAADPKSTGQVKIGKRKRRSGKEAVVHEFSQSIKHATFLRGSAGTGKKKAVTEFVEGKGWVDEDGDVVEESKPRKRVKVEEPKEDIQESSDESEDSSSSSSSEDDTSDDETEAKGKEAVLPAASELEDSSTSSSGTSSENTSSSDSSEEASSDEELSPAESSIKTPITLSGPPNLSIKTESLTIKKRPGSSGPSSGLSITIPDSALKPVHPLEALYKKPKTDSTKPNVTSNSFSFFGADGDQEDEEVIEAKNTVPLTPFTRKEFDIRGIRSAAPTPDTAFASKRFVWPVGDDDDEGQEDEEKEEKPTSNEGNGKEKVNEVEASKASESEFWKWFYEHRGDTTRAWKKRRREAAKEKRQRDNRGRGERRGDMRNH